MSRITFILKTSFGMVPSALRERLFWLFPLMAIAALLEMVGLALVVPLINALAGTESSETIPILSRAMGIFGNLETAQTVVTLAVTIAAFYVVKNAVLLFTAYAENSFIMQAVASTAADLLRTYLHAPYFFHLRHNSAELIRNLSLSVDDTFRSVLRSILRLILEALIVLGTFAVLVAANPSITLMVGAGFVVFLGLFFATTQPLLARWGRRIQVLHKGSLQTLAELLGMIKEIKVLGREKFFAESYAILRREMSRIYVWHQTISELPRLLIETLLIGAFVVAIVLVYAQGKEARDALPILALYALAGFRLMPSFNRIAQYVNTIRFSVPSLDQVARHQEDIRSFRLSTQPIDPIALRFDASLALDRVSFRYEGSSNAAIENVSIRIEKGWSFGLIGASGSGKTTLANLILGLLELQHGSFLVDDRDVRSNIAGWQKIVGYVPQEIMLLDDTLRRNVALGIEDQRVDEGALNDAIKRARLDPVVAELPQALDTVVGERGVRLSGGQRQRIGIARALYHRPQVLIMDEATSALDNETEREIANALAELHGKITMVIIAHRLSTVRHCDMLVFMKDGRIADTGTFDDLHARNAEFRRMVELGELTPKAAANA